MVRTEVDGWAKGLVAKATRLARRSTGAPTTAHLLLALVHEHGEAARLLSLSGATEGRLRSAMKRVDVEPSGTLSRVLESCASASRTAHAPSPELQLFYALMREPRGAAAQTLRALGVAPEAFLTPPHQDTTRGEAWGGMRRDAPRPNEAPRPRLSARPERLPGQPVVSRYIAPLRKHPRPSPEADAPTQRPAAPALYRPDEEIRPEPEQVAPPRPKDSLALDPELTPLLFSIGRNLTLAALREEIDPVYGREAEIESILDILARRRSNNALLVGPAGVGKTAIVEGLALELLRREGEESRLVIEVSAGSLVAGTAVRGALSKRIQALTAEVEKMEGRVILFLDEIHAIVSPSAEGPDDLAHELKAALARGRLPCIGATTEAEYKRTIERDPALERRFSRIDVEEPSREATRSILEGAIVEYEAHHGLSYDEDALDAAIELGKRFMSDRVFPDLALSILDLAGARARRRGANEVGREAVAEVIAEQAGISVDRLMVRDGERLLRLEASLGQRVVGHEECIRKIAEVLRKGAAGFGGGRPLGSFLFLGPTGVGKTEMAKAIAESFFDERAYTRIDMSEYSEPHSVARLFGAPPGYIGHEEGGQLTEPVRARPYQLILLDEIEKAHPEVLLALLPLLDEGRLTDGRGRLVDFKNTIIVMTSNLGASAAQRVEKRSIGFGATEAAGRGSAASREANAAKEQVLRAAERALPPEFWNRIDEPLYFGSLGRDEVAEIAERLLRSLAQNLQREKGIELCWRRDAIDALIEQGGYDIALGARPMRRVIGRAIESPLASRILERRYGRGDRIRILGEGDEIRFERVRDEVDE